MLFSCQIFIYQNSHQKFISKKTLENFSFFKWHVVQIYVTLEYLVKTTKSRFSIIFKITVSTQNKCL